MDNGGYDVLNTGMLDGIIGTIVVLIHWREMSVLQYLYDLQFFSVFLIKELFDLQKE